MNSILTDSFGRAHNYLRLSIIERCNLRCQYCMPEEGIPLRPKDEFMTFEEIETIAKKFVELGVNKIRLTGGEPLIRKDLPVILGKLSNIPVELAITTNGILLDKYLDPLIDSNFSKINISIDSLKEDRFKQITRRSYFKRVMDNILLAMASSAQISLNMVVIKGFNDDEILDFVELTRENNVQVNFIEYMPFDGTDWNLEQCLPFNQLLNKIEAKYPRLNKLSDGLNDTSKKYQVPGYSGRIGIISSVSNGFCNGCNRIRLTADGKLKNCLFGESETDILGALRSGKEIEPLIRKAIKSKFEKYGGNTSLNSLNLEESKNRPMTTIGG